MMTNDYVFYNRNPEGNRINDCVCRAISAATGLSYEATDRLLTKVAEVQNCDKLCVCCYKNLLSQFLGYKKYICKPNTLVRDVIKDFASEIVIIRIPGHLTCAKKGVLIDTWDCLDYEVDCLWIVS